MNIKRAIIITACVFALLIGYGVYVRIEPPVDDRIANEVLAMLLDNGYDVITSEGVGLFDDIKTISLWSQFDEDLSMELWVQHPEIFFVDISLYASENDAIIKTGQFSPRGDVYLGNNGSYTHLGYHSAPRFYRMGNAIIVYIGVDSVIRELLDAYCGKPFAGAQQ